MRWSGLWFLAALVVSATSVFAAAPVIDEVDVWLEADSLGGGQAVYGRTADFIVSDADGIGDIKTLTVTDPDGVVRVIDGPGWSDVVVGWDMVDADTLRVAIEELYPTRQTPPPAGPYIVTATDAGGQSTTLTTRDTRTVPVARVVTPENGSVIHDSRPTFQWDTGVLTSPDATARLSLFEEGWPGLFWPTLVSAATQVAFNWDGQALRSDLAAGHTYIWYLSVETPLPPASDPRVRVWAEQELKGWFTVYEDWPALPVLPGKLAYGVYMHDSRSGDWQGDVGILSYSPDPDVRGWPVGLDRIHPDWSPDGKALLYQGGGVRVDRLDGTKPWQVAKDSGADADAHWSPDGKQVVYSTGTSLRVVNSDGTNAHVVVEGTSQVRYCSWSADGQWIAFLQLSDTSGLGVRLVHPDASGGHAVTASGVQGYASYQVTYLGAPAWAPDAQRLVAPFVASVSGDSSQSPLSGIGTIPAVGGLLRPVWLNPAGVVENAQANLPIWSPDGTKIVFTSAHHLLGTPDWSPSSFQAGAELWMINADGSGQPTRLTYDYSYNGTTSWWAPDLFTDVRKGNWAYCAISTCKLAGIVSGYPDGTYRPLTLVTRDQMAAHIARGLTGGEAGIPAATGPVFSDVPASYWAAKYIAFCKDRGIVAGYPDGTYGPTGYVDRGQMAVYASRAVAGGEAGIPAASTSSVSDVPPGFWALKYIEYAKSHGIVGGYPDGTYRPWEWLTREQMAMYVARAFHLPM